VSGAAGAAGRPSGRGLLLAGGAARGAFQAGVVSALDRAGVRFDAIVGTSVGAVNGAALLHGYGPDLPGMWRENLRAVAWFDARRVLRGESPFLISEAMRLMVARYADAGRVRRHPCELLVSTTEWESGRNVLFSSHDRDAGWSDEEITLQFLASLTIPFLCTERIVIRGRRYCDGGLSDNYPLEPLVARGCREVVIVDPSPGMAGGAWPLTGALRALSPIGGRLDVLPLPAARLAAGVFRAALRPPPARHGAARIRLVVPPRPLPYGGLDFTRPEAIDGAITLGEEVGARVAVDLLSEEAAVAA
jgi:predicted acylesterase/phospholipase RssA